MGCCACWSEPTTKRAFELSWISLALTVMAAMAGIGLYISTGSSLCLVFGLENCVDFLSSAVVLWRFFAPNSTSAAVDAELEAKLARREERASVAISFILILLGWGVFVVAMKDFIEEELGDDEEDYVSIITISFFGFLIFAILCLFKFKYANVLNSSSLYKDGICSLIGTILSAALFIDSILISTRPKLWWIDPLVAMIAGIASIVYGVNSVVEAQMRDKIPIFSLNWWLMSQGSDTPTTTPTSPAGGGGDGHGHGGDGDGSNKQNGHSSSNENGNGDEDGDLQTLELTETNNNNRNSEPEENPIV